MAGLEAFGQIWGELMTTPVHLDSLLSKLTPKKKSLFAQIIPQILLRPVSLAESLGVGVGPDEPWCLTNEQKANWRPAQQIAERLHQFMERGGVQVEPVLEDFPSVMTQEWISNFGADVAQQLAKTLALEAPLSLRAKQIIGPKTLMGHLKNENALPVRAAPSSISPLGVRLDGYAEVLRTESFSKGEFEIQDEGSQFMSLFALNPSEFGAHLQDKPGNQKQDQDHKFSKKYIEGEFPQSVVDACAGAGGKSLALADLLGGKGRVFSYDVSEKKLQGLRRRATRAGYNNIQAVLLENERESEKLSAFKNKSDLVLVDAPCSGWGVLRRNPDIKWRQNLDSLERMPQIQLRLLKTYSELVKPGGRLVMGVCTFRKAETTQLVNSFLNESGQFEALKGGYLGPGPCDGFFMQAFIKKRT